jgi:hypothetical protein
MSKQSKINEKKMTY